MSDTDRRVGGVHRLATRAGGPVYVDLEVVVVDYHLDLVGLGQDADRRRRCVNPALRLGHRDPLDPVNPALVLQAGPCILTADQYYDLAKASHVGLPGPHRLNRPAVDGGQRQIHLVEVTGEEVGLLATLRAPDLEDHRAAVIGVAGQKKGAQLTLQTFNVGRQVGHLVPEELALVTLRLLGQLPGRLQVILGAAQRPPHGQNLLQFLKPASRSLEPFGVPDNRRTGQPGCDLRVLSL